MNEVITQSMTAREAREWKARVGSAANSLRVVLYEGYTREVWRALGYTDWTECVKALAEEFGLSERRIWQLHSANHVELLLNNCSVGEIPEGQLRPLTALPPEQQAVAWQRAVETAPNGKITAAHVQEIVNEFKPNGNGGHNDTQEPYHHVSDDSYEWYTPAEYIEAARLVMGGIDLDPASCEEAQKVIKAKRFYTKEIDGLTQKWHGRIWLNPPYCMPDIEKFVNRTIDGKVDGEISQAIVLTNNCTDTAWFHRILGYAGVACFTRGRIKFYGRDGESANGARQGQTLFYLGENVKEFIERFRQFGAVVRAA